MQSTLFEIFGIPIRSYGLMMAVGFALGIWRAVRVSRTTIARKLFFIGPSLRLLWDRRNPVASQHPNAKRSRPDPCKCLLIRFLSTPSSPRLRGFADVGEISWPDL